MTPAGSLSGATDRGVECARATRVGVAGNAETVNPYAFVVGAARSGTTLLQRMLDAHPQLAVVNETYWLPRKFRERTGLTGEGLVTPALLPRLVASPKFPRVGVTEGEP